MMAQIMDLPSADRFNLATLRKVLYGGPSIPIDLLKRAIRFFGCDMVQSYGQVESAGVLTFLQPEDHSLDEGAPYMRRLTSVGKEAIGSGERILASATSGGYGHTINKTILMAYLPVEFAAPGTDVGVEIMRGNFAGSVEHPVLYDPKNTRQKV